VESFSEMKKIVVSQNMDLSPDQISRLKSLGEVKLYNDLANTPEDWLGRVKGFDIICTGKFGLRQKIYELKDVFLSLPFVGIGWLEKEKLNERNITVAYAPGCNKDAVSEWIVAMTINLLREFPAYIRVNNLPKSTLPERSVGLTGKEVTILGAGNIGTRVGEIFQDFDMKVSFFKRGDSLLVSVKDADVVVNTLSENPTTLGLLDSKFFEGLKKGAYFISITSPKIFDTDSLISALGKNLAGAAVDAADVQVGDTYDPYYKKLLEHPKILVTPHIAYNSDTTSRVGNDMMIDNIEAYLAGKPTNLL
jgi:phosphoglycerate dehydrogenase-like enzyme